MNTETQIQSASILLLLPVEIWHKIFTECLRFPGLLEPHFFDRSLCYPQARRVNENAKVEAILTNMRLVCKSWDGHLKQHFTNRYIFFSDVYHRILPFDALTKAQRIRFNECQECKTGVECRKYAPGFKRNFPTRTPQLQYLSSFIELVNPLKVEIIDGRIHFETLIRLAKQMPRVKVIQSAGFSKEYHPTRLVEAYPKLQYLELFSEDIDEEPNRSFLSPSHITDQMPTSPMTPEIAQLIYHSWEGNSLPFGGRGLVNLQRLEIHGTVYLLDTSNFRDVLKVVGSSLRHLVIGTYGITQTALPSDLWILCPCLETLETRMCIGDSPLIPAENKLSQLSIPYPLQSTRQEPEFITPIFADQLRSFPNLRQLRLVWTAEVVNLRRKYQTRRIDWLTRQPAVRSQLLDWLDVCNELHIKVVEYDGMEFDMAMLSLSTYDDY